MRINNNLMAMNTHRQLGINSSNGARSIEKLSSGLRINRAGDDAAGLAISEKMRAQVRGLNQASRNSQDGISMIQTAEGALNETQAILQRMRELAVQSANDTNVNADRTSIQDEINQLSTEITRIAETTEFNTQKLLNGTLTGVKFQIGANQSQDMSLSIAKMDAVALEVYDETITVGTKGSGIKSVTADIDFDIEGVELTAVAGGSTKAIMEGADSGIDTDSLATDINMVYAKGVDNAEGVTFNGAKKIAIAAGADIPWNDIDTASGVSTGTIKITAQGSGFKVEINVYSNSGGGVEYDITDVVSGGMADANGNISYNAHGVSFTLTADDLTKLNAAGASGVTVTLSEISSGTDEDFTADISTDTNYSQVLGAGGTDIATFSGGKIDFDATSAAWIEGVGQIVISGTGLSGNNGQIKVTLKTSGGAVLSEDVYIFSGSMSGADFEYNNHGVSFTINVGHATDIQVAQDIEVIPNSVAVASGTFNFTVTDDNGDDIDISVDFEAGNMSVEQIAAAINAAVTASSGTFAGNVAVVSGESIKLQTAFKGNNAKITIASGTDTLSGLFTAGAEETGADSSVTFTLTDASGNTIDTVSGVALTDASVTFTDADGNEATFTLASGLEGMADADIPDAFATSDITREITGIDVSTQSAAAAAITTINNAIESVSTERSKLGAVQNRLEHTIKNLDTSSENLQASESRIRDVDMAKEMMEFTKNNILQQAAQAMLAQANQAPQGVLQLLR